MHILIPSNSSDWEDALIVQIKDRCPECLVVPYPEPVWNKRVPLMRFLGFSSSGLLPTAKKYRILRHDNIKSRIVSIQSVGKSPRINITEETIPLFKENNWKELSSIAENIYECNDYDSLVLFMKMALPYIEVNEQAVWKLYELFCKKYCLLHLDFSTNVDLYNMFSYEVAACDPTRVYTLSSPQLY